MMGMLMSLPNLGVARQIKGPGKRCCLKRSAIHTTLNIAISERHLHWRGTNGRSTVANRSQIVAVRMLAEGQSFPGPFTLGLQHSSIFR